MATSHGSVEVAVHRQYLTAETPFYVDVENAVYWVDIEGQEVNRLQIHDGALRSWSTPERACGIVPGPDGTLVLGLPHALVRFDLDDASCTKLVEIEPDKAHNRTNEMRCDPTGRLWVGTMCGDGKDAASSRSAAALYRYDGASLEMMLTGIGESNTLAWVPDGRFYFADTPRNMVWQFDRFDPRPMGRHDFFTPQGLGKPDGSAIDADGCLWNCRFGAGCVVRITPDGDIDRRIDVPATNPTSCVFAGPGLSTLFITSKSIGLNEHQLRNNPLEGCIFAVDTSTTGSPTHPFTPVPA